MARNQRPIRRRQPPSPPWGTLAALLLLVGGLTVVVFNSQHSGDPLKIRRELRKF